MSAAKTERLGPTRAEVLHHLRTRASAQGVEAVASAVGLHPSTTRFHLDALTEAGLVVREVENRGITRMVSTSGRGAPTANSPAPVDRTSAAQTFVRSVPAVMLIAVSVPLS